MYVLVRCVPWLLGFQYFECSMANKRQYKYQYYINIITHFIKLNQ